MMCFGLSQDDAEFWRRVQEATAELENGVVDSTVNVVIIISIHISTRTVQPVATCRQSPYVHKPAIVKLLLQFPFQVWFPCSDHTQPATPTSVTDTLASPTTFWF